MTNDLIRKAIATNAANLALGHEVFDADGARFVRDRAVPDIRDANHVTRIEVSSDDEIERLLARMDQEFAGFPHRVFHIDYTTPPAFEARLQLDGYERGEALVMVLEGGLRGATKPFEIKQVDSDDAWDAFHGLQRVGWAEYTARLGRAEENPNVGQRMFQTYRGKCPPLRYWLAYDGGHAVGHLSSWEGVAGVGQVEDLAVLAEHRHRGIATALLHRCVADCRQRGAGPVVIVADPTDTPKQMYAAMGCRPVAVKREYRRMAS